MTAKIIKTRFAPSPTGALHIGGLRTALYSYLFAKKNGGEFLLRIEDTDSKRFVPHAEEYIKASLRWVGLDYDESKVLKQSERKVIYKKYADQLIKDGKAYYAFDTPEELEAKKEEFASAGIPSPQYNYVMRAKMANSLTLSDEEVQKRFDNGDPFVIRIKMPRKEEIRFKDKVKGWIVTQTDNLDDKVIWKSSDGLPTYHLANVVDDYSSQITHVIRGVEWLPSTPLHVHLYKSLGWEEHIPTFVHLPLLTYKGKKLSKRNADQYGIPVYFLPWEDYDNFMMMEFSPEALMNFLALIGWNPGTDQEIFSMEEMVEAFTLERIGNSSGSEVDMEKASWINAQHLRKLPIDDLFEIARREDYEFCTALMDNFSVEYCKKALSLIQERCVFPSDILKESKFFFATPELYNDEVIKKHWVSSEIKTQLVSIRTLLSEIEEKDFTLENTERLTKDFLKMLNIPFKHVFPLLRTLLVGDNIGPPMFDIISHLGKKESLLRLDIGIEYLSHFNNKLFCDIIKEKNDKI